MIICTDEFYRKSGKTKEQSNWDKKEEEDVQEQIWQSISSSFLFDTLDEHLVSSFNTYL